MDHYFLVTVGSADVFCAEITLARIEPEVVVGTMMVHIEREGDDDPVDLAVDALRSALDGSDCLR